VGLLPHAGGLCRLVAKYLEVSLDFFRKARQEYGQIFLELRRAGIDRVVLVGRGELAEIALLAARETDVEIAGLLDAEMNEDVLLGIPVLRSLKDAGGAAFVITASRQPQAAYDGLFRQEGAERIVRAPSFLRVSVVEPRIKRMVMEARPSTGVSDVGVCTAADQVKRRAKRIEA
jgi:hypothetical protein